MPSTGAATFLKIPNRHRCELIGDFKNLGRPWRPKGDPERVKVHDFVIPTQGKAIPYGVYDLSRNEGWVSVGVDHDTAHFAVKAIRSWWKRMGTWCLSGGVSPVHHGRCRGQQRRPSITGALSS